MSTYTLVKVHNFAILTVIRPKFVQYVTKMYINTSLKYHGITDTQTPITCITNVHDLLEQPSYFAVSLEENVQY